jgi:uncharacterized repeat protein (TIGR01451 family)
MNSSTVVSGHDVVYTITLKNLGPGAAQGVVVSDHLASNVTYVSGLGPAGFSAPTLAGGVVTFTANQFAAGPFSARFTIVARVSSTAGSNTWVSNSVSVSATNLSSKSVTTASVKARVNAAGAGLVGSSLGNGQTDLVVTGAAGSDWIYVVPTVGNQLLVIENGQILGPFAAPTGRIVVYAGNGNDMVYVSPLLTEQSWIFGGTGNDLFYADSGNSVLVGGSGRNTLVSGRGHNLLIGGSGGGNMILGAQGDNVEIAGSTNCDANEAALAAILAEWSGSDPYAKRVAAIAAEMTITPGTGSDYLYGGSGGNTYFAHTKVLVSESVLARDYIFQQKSTELVTQI